MASTSSSSSTDAKGKGKAFESTLPQPLPPSSFSSSMVYDVFLNHRGCDVKEGLATDIYHALNRMGLRVFLDKEVLQYGASIPREIEDAMSSASLCIAIFSPKYAESSWCLDELSFMVKNNIKIFPIFYNVKPSDLRWVAKGKGVYASAFSQRKMKLRYTAQKAEEWKAALSNVSFLYGHQLKNKEDEGRLLKSIVNSVLKDMQIVPLEVARHPTGLDEIVEDFQKSAFKSSDRDQHVNIVGIVGMGGSGKTTLANELYNKECPNFARHSFISEVRDAAAKNTLHNLQEKLLRDLLSERFNISIDSISEGKGILRTRLRSLRVLIVLDDVDHVDQIDALLPEKGIFASGSLIIVTTRELKALKSTKISCIYKMKPLNASHAKQLFCWHAFVQSDPVQEFEDLVEEVIKACQGLPLSLKVLGRQLYKESKDYWVSQLDKISRILPEDIKKRLKISFDALDREEKEMFLDTACFFLGEEKSLAIEVWNGSGWSGLHGWESLLSKCLVEFDQENRIRMHDHLRDMGRDIALEWSPYRLFPSSSNLDISRLVQERIPIRGIMEASTYRSRELDFEKPSSDYRPFSKEYIELKPASCRVQLLVAANEFSKEHATLSKELRWLRLFKFQHSCLPSWLLLENLRVLELYDSSHLEELWQDNMQQPPLQLRELIIRLGWKNRFQRFPSSIRRLGHLKKLSCVGGSLGSLQNLPKGFCNLQSLEHLELRNLKGLSSLPSRFGDLTNLRHLDLRWCSKLKMLPGSFKQLKQLQYLNLQGCSNLTFSKHNADILENIMKLEYLNFGGCEGLQVLPHHITKQAFLREVDLKGTRLSELPSSIGQLERLEVLRIGSAELESLPDSLGNLSSLTRLEMDGCDKVRSLPESLGHLERLEVLRISSAELESLPDSLGNLSSLTRLEIQYCEKVRSLPESLGRLALLESIEINDTRVESLPKAFEHLTSLQTLSITNSPIGELFFEFEESSSLPRLKNIFIKWTRMSTISIPEDFCPSLESLSVHCNDFLVEIRTLPRTVKTIQLLRCGRLKDIAGIRSLRNLQYLTIEGCEELAELPSFAEFASMKEITIKECQMLGKIEGFEQLTSLESLHVHTQWEVPGITSLEQAQGLRRLELAADNIGALEPCIETLQKWPGDVTICARALGGVELVVKAFTSSNLRVVEACSVGAYSIVKSDDDYVYNEDKEADEDGCRLKYRKTHWFVQEQGGLLCTWGLGDAKTCLSHEATIVCLVINCLYNARAFVFGGVDLPPKLDIELREGKWVWIFAVSQDAINERNLEIHLMKGNRVETGLIGRGEEREVKDVFCRVLEALKM